MYGGHLPTTGISLFVYAGVALVCGVGAGIAHFGRKVLGR